MRTRFPAPQSDYFFVIQPSDANNIEADTNNVIDAPFCSIYCGSTSAVNIAVHAASDTASSPTSVIFKNVQPGTTLPIAVRRVLSTGTTAAAGDLIGMVGKMGFQ